MKKVQFDLNNAIIDKFSNISLFSSISMEVTSHVLNFKRMVHDIQNEDLLRGLKNEKS